MHSFVEKLTHSEAMCIPLKHSISLDFLYITITDLFSLEQRIHVFL